MQIHSIHDGDIASSIRHIEIHPPPLANNNFSQLYLQCLTDEDNKAGAENEANQDNIESESNNFQLKCFIKPYDTETGLED